MTIEVFFRPKETSRVRTMLTAQIYNLTRVLLARAPNDCLFVPIRSMQFHAVIDQEEIVFIDAAGGHIVQNNEGGRIIQIAWQSFKYQQRVNLDQPIEYDHVEYCETAGQHRLRLIGEFYKALQVMDTRSKENSIPVSGAKIIPLGS